MRRQLTGFALMLCGLLALGLGFSVGFIPTPAAAMPALQPSPRPTLVPTSDARGDDYDYPDAPLMGRITGTVIDIRTGTPAAGKRVMIGERVLTSDSNGNYDIWVEAGQYPVSLTLGEGEGTVAQAPTMAMVWGNDVVVVHLFFTSLAPAPAATATAPAATATALPVPTPVAPPVALPDDLPDSSVEAKPSNLPVTGDELIDPQSLVLGGLALLALGASLMMLPRRAPARVGVSAPRARRRRQSAKELLEELLRRDP
ncbi:MAG: carboxypeptidase-like regulatory domain-containing protein [Chloroflexales bacterium]|nr:carboxypeptidase-like regulatory domain-containing protein [Chloroflexales bacterium]